MALLNNAFKVSAYCVRLLNHEIYNVIPRTGHEDPGENRGRALLFLKPRR